ncbi:MAG: ABC transporter ATP-binding protein [Aquihabitans sp.]
MTGALVLSGVDVAYPDGSGRRVILDGLDLELAAGELVVISGDSGAGKSTLLTVAGLLRRPDRGEVTIAGTPTSHASERARTALRREHLAFVYQSANLLPSLTAIEQLQLVGHIRRRRPSASLAPAQALLDELGVGGRAHQIPAQLSGGERQRVGIARALMAEPAVLIADEPTASLDPERAGQVAELLAQVTRERGIATLVVAHDEATRRRADRLLHLADGVLSAPTSSVRAPEVPG